jgi:tetratricopeptide (TPR) repeat protein
VLPTRVLALGHRIATMACFLPWIAVAQLSHPADQPKMDSSHMRASIDSMPQQPHVATAPISTEMRGDIYMARKMYPEAVRMYSEAPQDSAIVVNKLGIAYHQLVQLELAKSAYKRALSLDPNYIEAINNLGTVFYAEKNYRKSISYYKRALSKSDGSSAAIFANLGAGYFARKQYKRASESYERALQLDPNVFDHRGGFGTLMQERTMTEIALFHMSLAKTFAKRGVNDRALIYLRKALEEGIKDRAKIPDIPEFAQLKKDPAFVELLAQNPRPL